MPLGTSLAIKLLEEDHKLSIYESDTLPSGTVKHVRTYIVYCM